MEEVQVDGCAVQHSLEEAMGDGLTSGEVPHGIPDSLTYREGLRSPHSIAEDSTVHVTRRSPMPAYVSLSTMLFTSKGQGL